MVCSACSPRWSRHHDRCVDCGTTSRKHNSGGRCWQCVFKITDPPGDYSDFSQNRQYHVNDFLFDDWTEVSSYVYGVLFADGCVSKDDGRRFRIDIALSASDESWLILLAKAIGFSGNIRRWPIKDNYRPREAVGIVFSSKRIHRRLREVGIKIQPPQMPDEMIPHFIRGFFDGDGSIYLNGQSRSYHTNFGYPENSVGSR